MIKKSPLWQRFSKIDATTAECDVCKEVVSYKTTTSNLRRHLQRKHPSDDFPHTLKQKKSETCAGKKRSPLWLHFTEIDAFTAKCNVCQKVVSYKTSISNLGRHLLRKHPSVDIPHFLKQKKSETNASKKRSPLWLHFTEIDAFTAKCDVCQNVVSYKTSTSNLGKHLLRKHPSVDILHTSKQMKSETCARKKRSPLWLHFTEIDAFTAKCDVCQKVVSYKTSTSNLVRHLLRKHPSVDFPHTNLGRYLVRKHPLVDIPHTNLGRYVVRKHPLVDIPHTSKQKKSETCARKKRSPLWQHFTKIDAFSAKCDVCQKLVSYKNTTSNLRRHLLRRHPSVDIPLTSEQKKSKTYASNVSLSEEDGDARQVSRMECEEGDDLSLDERDEEQQFCLKSNEFPSHMFDILLEMQQADSMVDVSLVVSGQHIQAHRIVLASCSPFFQEIFADRNEDHVYVSLPGFDVEDVHGILEFVYRGEINVPAEKYESFLRAAEELNIRGLIDVSSQLPCFETAEEEEEEEGIEEDKTGDVFEEETRTPSMDALVEASEEMKSNVEETDEECRRETTGCLRKGRWEVKKEYSESSMTAALADIEAGRLLMETAEAHGIPRSTLYVHAKALRIPITMTRHEYSEVQIQAAVNAVKNGISLKKASEKYEIPKSILWRRVERENDEERLRFRSTYDPERKKAAIEALERGENISKVSREFQIPRRTLFREKARLVDSGKLPGRCPKRRLPTSDEHCLEEQGKMSQPEASHTYKVPKTTIRRPLRQSLPSGSREEADDHPEADECSESRENKVQYCEEPNDSSVGLENEQPVAYVEGKGEGTEILDGPMIVLTTGEEDMEGKQQHILQSISTGEGGIIQIQCHVIDPTNGVMS